MRDNRYKRGSKENIERRLASTETHRQRMVSAIQHLQESLAGDCTNRAETLSELKIKKKALENFEIGIKRLNCKITKLTQSGPKNKSKRGKKQMLKSLRGRDGKGTVSAGCLACAVSSGDDGDGVLQPSNSTVSSTAAVSTGGPATDLSSATDCGGAQQPDISTVGSTAAVTTSGSAAADSSVSSTAAVSTVGTTAAVSTVSFTPTVSAVDGGGGALQLNNNSSDLLGHLFLDDLGDEQ